MKGIIIYENDLRGINAVKLKNASFCYESIEDDKTDTLQGTPVTCASTTCNKEDTYDFEVGALIALMKMCGVEKVTKACDELYRDDNYKNALQEVTESLDSLSKKYDLVVEGYDYWKEQCKKLNKENEELKKNIDELFENDTYRKSEIARLSFKNHRLEEENEKLKLDCEKLQHGYNDMIFCGGRQNGKQYALLVDLFKKLGQKKVDEAYKEAYNTKLPLWQKKVLNQMYGIYKESKEKIELPGTLDINGTTYRKTVQIKGFNIKIKPPTKREEMWENILGASKCPPVEIKVAKQDITSFLRELQDKIAEIRWNGSDCPPVELSVPDWFKHDYIYFALFRNDDKGNLRMCYDNKPHSWINKPVIEYIAPMRWDLFKKGRIAVRLTKDNYKDFYDICEKELGRSPSYKPEEFAYTPMEKFVLKYNKKSKGYTFLSTTETEKIVDWEDVR